MVIEDELKLLTVPQPLAPFVGDYYKALVKRAANDLVGESEFRCFRRFLQMYASGKYKFSIKEMERMFKFLHLLIYIDEDGKPHHLELLPVQKFIMCGIFGFRRPNGRYLVNTANIYIARRNGKSFLLSAVLHYLMGMSKFRNELIVLASVKGQNAMICFNEFSKFIDNDHFLKDTYSNVNRTACWAQQKYTGNKLEMFRTGAGAKKSLDGFTNKVAVVDEEMLCDEIVTKTIQDGQAHFKDSLLVTMSTAQFSIGSDNHKKWLTLRKELYEDALPEERFLFLCEPDAEDISGKHFDDMHVWGKANPVLLFQSDGFTVKDHIRKRYMQKAREALQEKGFTLQSFVTKQCNTWYSAEDRTLCSYDQMQSCRVNYSMEDCIKAGYTDWYLGIDLSHTLDLTSVAFCTYVGEDEAGKLVANGLTAAKYRLFVHVLSWMPRNKLQQHVENDKFEYRGYVDKELFLCDGAGGDNIDTNQVYAKIEDIYNKYGLHFTTIAADPYGVAGMQDALCQICDTFILQNQSPKSLSQYIEVLSGMFKDATVAYQGGHEDILEKAIANSLLIRNPNGYYSIEKISLRADSNIRIDPVDAFLTGFIAPYIDFNRRAPSGDEILNDWFSLVKGESE